MNRFLTVVFSFATATAVVSCSGQQDPEELTPSDPQEPYTLSVDKTTIESDGKDVATLVIKDANGLVLTEGDYLRETSFYIEETDEWQSGKGSDTTHNVFSSIIDGTYTISAMYQGKECANTVSVSSRNRDKYEIFHKNVAIYRLTGTWCQYCPNMTEALDNRNEYTKDHSIVLQFHNNDEFALAFNASLDLGAYLLGRYGTSDAGYPYCIYSLAEGSGKKTSPDIQRFVKSQLFENAAKTGIRATSTCKDGVLEVSATVKASADGTYDLGVAVLKDGCIPSAAGAYEEVYNDVVIWVSGNFCSMSSEAFSLASGEEKPVELECKSPKISTDDCRVVLFTLTEVGNKVIIDNAVEFNAGGGVEYRYN